MPTRTESYRQFVNQYPYADFTKNKHESGRTSEIAIGMRHDIVEAMFVGIYNEDGSVVAEQHFDESTLSSNLGVVRVFPQPAIEIGIQNAIRFAGPIKSTD